MRHLGVRTSAYVDGRLTELARNEDLSRYVL